MWQLRSTRHTVSQKKSYIKYTCERCGRPKKAKSPNILCSVCTRIANKTFDQVLATPLHAEWLFIRDLLDIEASNRRILKRRSYARTH
jgi:hypothetical protein